MEAGNDLMPEELERLATLEAYRLGDRRDIERIDSNLRFIQRTVVPMILGIGSLIGERLINAFGS